MNKRCIVVQHFCSFIIFLLRYGEMEASRTKTMYFDENGSRWAAKLPSKEIQSEPRASLLSLYYGETNKVLLLGLIKLKTVVFCRSPSEAVLINPRCPQSFLWPAGNEHSALLFLSLLWTFGYDNFILPSSQHHPTPSNYLKGALVH